MPISMLLVKKVACACLKPFLVFCHCSAARGTSFTGLKYSNGTVGSYAFGGRSANGRETLMLFVIKAEFSCYNYLRFTHRKESGLACHHTGGKGGCIVSCVCGKAQGRNQVRTTRVSSRHTFKWNRAPARTCPGIFAGHLFRQLAPFTNWS